MFFDWSGGPHTKLCKVYIIYCTKYEIEKTEHVMVQDSDSFFFRPAGLQKIIITEDS